MQPSFHAIPASDFHGIAIFPQSNLRGNSRQPRDRGLEVCRGGFHQKLRYAGRGRPFHGGHRQRTSLVARDETQPAPSRTVTSLRTWQSTLFLLAAGRGLYFRRGRAARCLPGNLAPALSRTSTAPRLELPCPGAIGCLRALLVAHFLPRTPPAKRSRRKHL